MCHLSQYMHVLLQNERTRNLPVHVIFSGTEWSNAQVCMSLNINVLVFKTTAKRINTIYFLHPQIQPCCQIHFTNKTLKRYP